MTPAEKLAEPLQRSVEPTGVFLGFFRKWPPGWAAIAFFFDQS